MKIIDAHQHFWKYDPERYSWINNEMHVIKKDFFPANLEIVFKENKIHGSVAIQSEETESNNEFLLKYAEQYDFIKGVVGWIDFSKNDLEQNLEHYQQYKKLKGFRHVLQGDLQRDKMLQPHFKKGISLLNKYGFTYDLLILPDQLSYAKELVSLYPEQSFVIDHLAKPDIKNRNIHSWAKDIAAFASCNNLYCKISGMVSEADWNTWKKDDFKFYLDVIVETFGMKRIMFGSDWPVCLVAASYKEIKEIVADYFSSFTENEQEYFFSKNATEFYNL